jgi:hypothetical protein
MASFSRSTTFPVGYFRAVTQWLLRERRDVVSRVSTIQADLARIGEFHVVYRTVSQGDEVIATEERVGFAVTRGSTLEKLLRAYVAQGGNPFDISPMLFPTTTKWTPREDGTLARTEQYPQGGLVFARSAAYNEPLPEISEDAEGNRVVLRTGYEAYPGGYVQLAGYFPSRMGGRQDRGAWDTSMLLRAWGDIRGWASQEIKNRVQNLEWEILRQCDLAEQLRRERDEVLLRAFAGTLEGLPEVNTDRLDPRRLCQTVISDMVTLLYSEGGTGESPERGFLLFALSDQACETAGPLGL